MLTAVAFLIAGLALLLKGGAFFVAAAVRSAVFLRLPRIVIGTTLVSLATTTPELMVSVMAGLRGESDLAVGNALGSCLCNLGLILGLTATLRRVEVHPRVIRVPLAVMFGFGIILLLVTLDLTLQRWQGGVLIAGGVSYFACEFFQHWRNRRPHSVAEARTIEAEVVATRWAWIETRPGTAFQFFAGALMVALGSRLLVDGASNLAVRFGVPSIIIGLTIVSFGTSLPELITAVTSTRQAVSDLAVGNVLGANIANLSIVVGAATVIQDVSIDRQVQLFNFPALLVMMGLLSWRLITRNQLSRPEGLVLMASYLLYLVLLIALAVRTYH